MPLIDTHAHIYLPEFQDHLQEIHEAMDQADVQEVLLPNIDPKTLNDLYALCAAYPQRYRPMIGLHPCSVDENYEADLEQLKSNYKDSPAPIIAIGEIGIDLYWDTSKEAEQRHAFALQIQWARERNLPVAIHVRNAFDEVFEVLEHEYYDGFSGVLHCFTGGKRHVRRALELNLHFGIGGVVTFDQGLPHTVKRIPLDRIILETDAPYLTPHPHRNEQNHPGYLPLIAQTVADAHGLPVDELAQITTANARRLFKLDLPANPSAPLINPKKS
jgi:TatD DNase family protein